MAHPALLIIDVQQGLCEGAGAAFDFAGTIARINALSAAAITASGLFGASVNTHLANAVNNKIKGTDVNSTLFQNQSCCLSVEFCMNECP